MASGFKARGDDDVHARLFERNRLIHRRRRPDGGDAAPAALIEDFFGRDSVDEAEGRYSLFEQNTDLIFKADRHVRRVAWENASHVFDVLSEIGKAATKSAFVGRKSPLILHRH